MVFINAATRQMAAKVVYYGPGLSGKTTNLEWIYKHTEKRSRGEMVSLETETDRTLFFDLLPLEVGVIGGFRTRFQLYTVPGQVFYNSTRKLVLRGVDGLVFVADSQRAMMEKNVESMKNLITNIRELGLDPGEIPIVFQYNKRDLKNCATVEELNKVLNKIGVPAFEGIAIHGVGVFETLKAISKRTLASIRQKAMTSGPARKVKPRDREEHTGPRRPAITAQKPVVLTHAGGRVSAEPGPVTQTVRTLPPTLQEASREKVEFARIQEDKVEKNPIRMKKVALRSINDIEKELNRLRDKVTTISARSESTAMTSKSRQQAEMEDLTRLLHGKKKVRSKKSPTKDTIRTLSKAAQKALEPPLEKRKVAKKEIRKHIKVRLKETDFKAAERIGIDILILGETIRKHFAKVMESNLESGPDRKKVVITLEIELFPKK